jgi:hypothetical protein
MVGTDRWTFARVGEMDRRLGWLLADFRRAFGMARTGNLGSEIKG